MKVFVTKAVIKNNLTRRKFIVQSVNKLGSEFTILQPAQDTDMKQLPGVLCDIKLSCISTINNIDKM